MAPADWNRGARRCRSLNGILVFFSLSFRFNLVVLCDARAAAASAKLPVQQTSGLAWPAKICAKKRNEEEGKSCKLCWEWGKATEQLLKATLLLASFCCQNCFILTSPQSSHNIDSALSFSVFSLICWVALGQVPEPSTTHCWLSTSLHVAGVCAWLDFVISVIVLIIQSQLAVRERERENWDGQTKEREKDEAGRDAAH